MISVLLSRYCYDNENNNLFYDRIIATISLSGEVGTVAHSINPHNTEKSLVMQEFTSNRIKTTEENRRRQKYINKVL